MLRYRDKLEAMRPSSETALLVSHRQIAHPPSASTYGSHEILHKRFRVRILRSMNVSIDEQLFFRHEKSAGPRVEWTGPELRPRLSVLLDGQAEIRVRGKLHALKPGAFFLNRYLGEYTKRMAGAPATLLALEWDLGSLGTGVPDHATEGSLAPCDLGALRRAVDAFSMGSTPQGSGLWLEDVIERLRAAGAPFDPPDPGAWAETAPPRAPRIITALDAALSHLEEQPMNVDLEAAVGVSRWQLQRQFSTIARHYGLNGETWRSFRQRWRLGMAFFFMTAPRATTESVARTVGYGSAIALCRAFSDAGLPSPGEVRRAATFV